MNEREREGGWEGVNIIFFRDPNLRKRIATTLRKDEQAVPFGTRSLHGLRVVPAALVTAVLYVLPRNS